MASAHPSSLTALAVPPAASASVTLAEVAAAAVAERVDRCRKAWGVIAAIVDDSGVALIPHGRIASDSSRTPDAHTVFEIGCIVRVFDALLLSEMAERGEVALTDRVADYLPSGTLLPAGAEAIALQHLAMQTSGLPGRRTSRAAESTAQTEDGLYHVLSKVVLTAEPGSLHEYSLIGTSLLRHALSRRAGLPYDRLMKTRVLDPLQMSSTGFGPSPETASRTAVGHNDRLHAVPAHPTEFRSTANDLSLFLAACLGLRPSPLAPAIARMLSVRYQIGAGIQAALGWNVETHGGDEMVCLEGVSWGFRAWIGYRTAVGRAAAICSNAAACGGVQDIGYHLLDSSYPLLTPDMPLMQPPSEPVVVELSVEELDARAGRYQLTPNVFVDVTCAGPQLYVEKTGMSRVPLYPESPTQFFCQDVDYFELPADTRLIFALAGDGTTTGVTLRQRGQDVWLPRAGRDQPAVWFGHVASTVDSDRLARYAGRYRLRSSNVTIVSERGELVAEFDGGLRVRLVPESATQFFIENDVVHVQYTFEVDAEGRATGLIATYDGVPRRGERIA